MKPASSANEVSFKCQRSKLQVPTKPASFAIETIFSAHYFPPFIGKHYLCKIFPLIGKLTEHKK